MAKLYEMPRDDHDLELTGSLAQSFKEGLILPAERKFNLLEREIAALREHTDDHFSRLDTENSGLKKLLRIVASLSLLSLAGIVTTLILLFNWY